MGLEGFNDALVAITGEISGFMYTYILVFLLVGTGIYFTIRTKGVQIRFIKDMFTQLTEKKHVKGVRAISSFQALMVSTASRVGTGNIAGIATALATGGPGAVFWMWLMAIVGAASAFVESTLAQIWKVRGEEGEFRGGPAYYIQYALGKRWLGVVFSVLLILCFAFGFNGLQAFNAVSALEYYIPDYATNGVAMFAGLGLTVMAAVVIFGGAKRISVITSFIVPVMAFAYIILAVWVTVTNLHELPAIFALVIESAFDFESIFGGFAGSVVMLGIKRGLYSNEAGMGSAPNAAATASVSHPVKQGLVQSLSVYIDTLLVCSCSAVMVLVFYVQDPATASSLNGMPLVQMAVNNSVGEIGIHFITFAIFMFAYSSLIGNYFYAESNMRFIKDDPRVLLVFRILCMAAIVYGAVNSFDLAWNLADIFMGLMAMMNLVVILLLGKWALRALDDYSEQRRAGKDPVFVSDRIEGMPATECWHVDNLEGVDGSK
ncbi:MAG: alanine:cation symporter family protein [Eggerthellaceae bacterium]|nr:alanine:cation symporter family protein [Eggerthellaceae bacterium]